jgi:hypothetical protein
MIILLECFVFLGGFLWFLAILVLFNREQLDIQSHGAVAQLAATTSG